MAIYIVGVSSASSAAANPKMSIIEIEAMLRERVRARYNDLHQVKIKSINLQNFPPYFCQQKFSCYPYIYNMYV